MITDINSEDRLVQETFADHLRDHLGWDSIYAYNTETFGQNGTLGRVSEREAVLVGDLRAALVRLNPDLPASAHEEAIEKLTHIDFARSLLQHNREFYGFIQGGVPVEWRDESGELFHAHARVIDFSNGNGEDGKPNNRFLAVRELKLQGMRVPHYNTRADLVCFVNGLPLVFIELKAVYKNIRAGFDNNLSWYLDPNVVPQAFHHNAFLVVSNGDQARYGSITSKWDHFVEWKRDTERQGTSRCRGAPQRDARQRAITRYGRKLHPVRRQPGGGNAENRCTKPSGFGGEQCRGLHEAPGGVEENLSRAAYGTLRLPDDPGKTAEGKTHD